jgi:hypothetical protein
MMNSMRMNLEHWVLAVAVGIGIIGGTAQAVAASFLQDHEQNHDQDYSKNRRYQQGTRRPE